MPLLKPCITEYARCLLPSRFHLTSCITEYARCWLASRFPFDIPHKVSNEQGCQCHWLSLIHLTGPDADWEQSPATKSLHHMLIQLTVYLMTSMVRQFPNPRRHCTVFHPCLAFCVLFGYRDYRALCPLSSAYCAHFLQISHLYQHLYPVNISTSW